MAETIEKEIDVRRLAAPAAAAGQVLGAQLDPAHAGALEERVRLAHCGHCLDVACLASLAEPANQQRAEAQGAELWVHDDAADRADVTVGEAKVGAARAVTTTQALLARGAAWDGVGEDGDGDEATVVAAVRRVTDGPDIGAGEGASGAVVKSGELVVVGQTTAGQVEGAGEESGEAGEM